jgi:putative PIG3 family NAD(P)H quinone oxidoreductase
MFAIEVRNAADNYVLALAETPVPQLRAGEILVKTAAAGVNRADLLQAKGKYPPPEGASLILGLEISGEVVATGADVTRWKAGDKVCALIPGGGYAQYACVPQACALPIPQSVGLVDAAGLPEAAFTAWTNLVDTARIEPAESVLIHGGSSGIGTTAIQLCRALGLTVFATAASAEKCARCESLGAARAINYQKEDYVAAIRSATGGRGVDVILDMVGGDYIERNFAAAAHKGRIVNIAFQKGATATVNFGLMLQKRLTFAATTLRGRSNVEKGAISDALLKTVWPLIEAGRITPVIDSTFPLAEAQAAHERMAGGGHIGKILLTA